jgi:hypothetical protein
MNRTSLNPPWACDRIADAAVPQVLEPRRPARHGGGGQQAAGRPSGQAYQQHHARGGSRPPVSRSKLDARIALYGLQEQPVRGDGNCQYRALAAALLGGEERHREVRERVWEVLAANREAFEHHVVLGDGEEGGGGGGGWDLFLAAALSDGEWGDHLTLQAAADAFGCVVMLVTSFEDDAAGVVSISPMLGGAVVREAPAMLSFYAERHYNALVPRTS